MVIDFGFMTYSPSWIEYAAAALYLLWVLYLAICNLYQAKKAGTIQKVALFLGYPLLILGVLLDIAVNITIMSVLFLERPRELLVTQRLTRHIAKGTGWRKKLAYWICSSLLNAFDPSGNHCD